MIANQVFRSNRSKKSAAISGQALTPPDLLFYKYSRKSGICVADALPGYVLRDSQQGGPGQILAEDALHRAGLLREGLDQTISDLIAEGNLSLTRHGSHQPFRQFQPGLRPGAGE